MIPSFWLVLCVFHWCIAVAIESIRLLYSVSIHNKTFHYSLLFQLYLGCLQYV
jgi:hypothetical protein